MFILQLVLIQIATFVMLVLVLRKLLYSETARALKRLQQLNRENEIKSEELHEKNEEAQKRYLQRVREAEEEIRKMKETAQVEAKQFKEKFIEEAKKESEKIILTAQKNKEALRLEIAREMEVKAIDFAGELLKEALPKEAVKKIHTGLVEEIILGIKELDMERIEEGITNVQVICAYALDVKEKKQIEDILSERTNKRFEIKEQVEDELIAGIIIKIGNLVLDASIANRLEEARQKSKRNIG